MIIMGIDPGTYESAFSKFEINGDFIRMIKFGKIENYFLKRNIRLLVHDCRVSIEMVACYGMAVGKEVFETCVWIGIFMDEVANALHSVDVMNSVSRITRNEVKNNICHSSRASDSNIRQALIDRFGPVGTKKNPGPFYGVSNDVWAATAVGVTLYDKLGAAI